jgi:hypothetical protein
VKNAPRVKVRLDDGFEGLLEVDGHLERLPVAAGPPLPFVGAEHGRAVLAVDLRVVFKMEFRANRKN